MVKQQKFECAKKFNFCKLEAIREAKAFRALKLAVDSIQLARINFELLENANEPLVLV